MTPSQQKQCYFCTANRRTIDYKDDATLRRFISASAKIYSRKKSGLCAYHQRRIAEAVKHARYLGLLPYTTR